MLQIMCQGVVGFDSSCAVDSPHGQVADEEEVFGEMEPAEVVYLGEALRLEVPGFGAGVADGVCGVCADCFFLVGAEEGASCAGPGGR